MAREVICATTDPSGPNDCRCITEIGYQYSTRENEYTKSPEEVHDDLENGEDYFVEHNRQKTDLEPASRGSTKYVRTEQNDTKDDNLLKLDDCS